jgi:hypothetical protein
VKSEVEVVEIQPAAEIVPRASLAREGRFRPAAPR